MTHNFNNSSFYFEILGSIELQPGNFKTEAKISNNQDNLLNIKFEMGIDDISKFSFGFQKWIFIPEARNYNLLNLETGEKFSQNLWFRENGRNKVGYLIKNYFDSNYHFSIYQKGIVVFNLKTLKRTIEKQSI